MRESSVVLGMAMHGTESSPGASAEQTRSDSIWRVKSSIPRSAVLHAPACRSSQHQPVRSTYEKGAARLKAYAPEGGARLPFPPALL